MVQDSCDLDIEAAFEKEERLVLLMVNMSAGPNARFDDVLEHSLRAVGLTARKQNLQSDGTREHKSLGVTITRVNWVHTNRHDEGESVAI